MRASKLKWLVIFVVVVAGLWLVRAPRKPPLTAEEIAARSAETERQIRAMFPPGYYDLINCSTFTSYLGEQTMTLSGDRKAQLEKDEGYWSFDETTKRYAVSVGPLSGSYSLLTPPGSDVCILVSGDSFKADLTNSWYAKVSNDSVDDEEQ